jgi:hypothetical protein
MAALDHPLTTGRVVYKMAMMLAGQEWHFEPSMRCVLGANKKPKAESADCESPSRSVVAAPTADEPAEDEGDQPNATNPNKVVPHCSDRLAGKVQGPLEAGANKDPLRVCSLRRPVKRLTSWPDMVRRGLSGWYPCPRPPVIASTFCALAQAAWRCSQQSAAPRVIGALSALRCEGPKPAETFVAPKIVAIEAGPPRIDDAEIVRTAQQYPASFVMFVPIRHASSRVMGFVRRLVNRFPFLATSSAACGRQTRPRVS